MPNVLFIFRLRLEFQSLKQKYDPSLQLLIVPPKLSIFQCKLFIYRVLALILIDLFFYKLWRNLLQLILHSLMSTTRIPKRNFKLTILFHIIISYLPTLFESDNLLLFQYQLSFHLQHLLPINLHLLSKLKLNLLRIRFLFHIHR